VVVGARNGELSKNFEMASSDGQHVDPEQHVDPAQDVTQKGRRQGGKSAKNFITSLKVTKSAT
jgi:hypothetical protein